MCGCKCGPASEDKSARQTGRVLFSRIARDTINSMTLEALKAMLTRHPFEPMRVKTGNGEVFEIRHPEMASLTKSALVIVHPDADGSPSDKVEYVSHLHVASVEAVTGAAA